MDIVAKVADALPTPACHEGLGPHCPAPFETVLSSSRPNETDATVRCRECGSCAHYVLDPEGHVLEEAALEKARWAEKASAPGPQRSQSPPQPQAQPVEPVGQADHEPEHDA